MFGQEVAPIPGAVLVFERGSGGHVGFALGQDDTHCRDLCQSLAGAGRQILPRAARRSLVTIVQRPAFGSSRADTRVI